MLDLTRRDLVLKGSAAVAAYALLRASRAGAFPSRPGEMVLPWLDQPAENPVPQVIQDQLVWEDFDSWITPNEKFFSIAHFDRPVIDAATWTLTVDGLVDTPLTLTLDDLKAPSRRHWEQPVTIECSGNHGLPFFDGGIGNAYWRGTPLDELLTEAGVRPEAIEVVFWGADEGDVTVRDVTMHQHFARSLPIEEAMTLGAMLAYEMNGEPLPAKNGFPLRLIVPGYYGIANVKWLTRIELRDSRLVNQFMARDYVTIREAQQDGETVWTETPVGRWNLKSVPGRVTRVGDYYQIVGAAWGGVSQTAIRRVEVQIDDGPWQEATIDPTEGAEFAWKIWSYDWLNPAPGEHRITSRAFGPGGVMQPAMDDPLIAGKKTYWESNGQVTRRVMIEG